MNEPNFKIVAIYDTETTTMNSYGEIVAFPCLFIVNKIKTSIKDYVEEESDFIRFFRSSSETVNYFNEIATEYKASDVIPVICAYNLMFDLQSILSTLESNFYITVNGQSSTSAYTVDLYDDDGEQVLRFWDVSFLDPRGLSYMGKTAGLEKTDTWDYNLIRTQETVITEKELEYAKRDVQIIPAFLRYLLENTSYITEEDLGSKVITKTSLVRLYGKRVIGKMQNEKGKSPLKMQLEECERERPRTFEQYALRKACGRGGLAFTSALNASNIIKNVYSIDVVSMHHAYMRRYVPCKFVTMNKSMLEIAYEQLLAIKNISVDDVLSMYYNPFKIAFNACIHIKNLKLKENSVFDRDKIATLAISKMHKSAMLSVNDSEAKQAANNAIMVLGYYDKAKNAVEAYSKLYEAEEAFIYVNEIEFWIMSRVYDFELIEVVKGEISYNKVLPPDLIVLMSSELYAEKQDVKKEIEDYKQAGKNTDELEMYYQEIIKAKFNAIYGTQVQDVNKPGYKMENGEIIVDEETILIDDDTSRQGITNYNYGSRIVAGSRMHLIIALELLYNGLGDSISFLGGDTDSIKFALKDDVDIKDALKCLEPLHDAVDNMITMCSKRAKAYGVDCDVSGVGHFVIDGHYNMMVEYWNKCRVGINDNGKIDYTCSGIARPVDAYTIDKIGNAMLHAGIDAEEVLKTVAGYNICYMPSVSFILWHKKPSAAERFEAIIKDYTGKASSVSEFKSVALYPISKILGDTTIRSNLDNIMFKGSIGQKINTDPIEIYQDNEYFYINKNYTLLYKVKK